MEASAELREEVRPVGSFRLRGLMGGWDRLQRRRGGVVERLIHDGEEPVVVRAAQTAPDRVLLQACARRRPAAEHGLRRMRFALGLDDDLSAFRRRFARDPVIGASVRARPWLRVARRPCPFEALVCAICEQLIEYERAAEIERRIVAALGRRCPDSGLRDLPTSGALGGTAPARLCALGLAGMRSEALVRAARLVASGRIDLDGQGHEDAWRRLRAIRGIGAWTVETLALHGQGRHDQLPAADLKYLKLVGRALSGGDPYARATEEEVRAYFAPYGEWAGLAATHALLAGARPPGDTARVRLRSPVRAGTRS